MISVDEESKPAKAKYPKSVFFIIGNEFCERFNYYGLRTVLTLFLNQRLLYSEDSSTVIYHSFSMVAYFTPLLGAILADSFLGKFKTIVYLSILYSFGSVILSFGAYPQELSTMKIITIVGLIVIGFGTGGIKPCVAAFGGDQFKEGQEKQLKQFFSVFYLSINLGSVIATFLTPILREQVHCFNETTCYSLAFGVPSIIMIVSLVIFICGKPLYDIRPPEGNIILEVSKCICYAIGKKCKSSEKKKPHWLDHADDKFDKKLIEDIKILFHVLVLYIPLPLFWALFDQQSSRWILQATRMDGQLTENVSIQADQMQVIGPLMIIAFIPIFQYIVYPMLNKCNMLKRPLQRMATGLLLTAVAFTISGLVELTLESSYPVLPNSGNSQITIINDSPCPVNIKGADLSTIDPFGDDVTEIPIHEVYTWNFTPENCTTPAEAYSLTFNASTEIESVMITLEDGKLIALMSNDSKEKSEEGDPQIRIFYNMDKYENENITFLLKQAKSGYKHFIDTEDERLYGKTEYCKFPPGKYLIYAPYNESKFFDNPVGGAEFKSGGVYIVNFYSKQKEDKQVFTVYEMVKGNEVSILYQIPQYVVITAAEIMFSITGLEFSYSQAPNSMKSVIQAVWLLTVAVGNLFVLIIAETKPFEKQSHELLFYAVLMVVDMIAFSILAYFYKYVTIKSRSQEQAERDARGRSNEAYVEETDFNK